MAQYLFATKDPQGRLVGLRAARFQEHILIEHPDMSDVGVIAQAVEAPDRIAQDAISPNRLIYYRQYQARPSRWVKVFVEQEEVLTAYRVRRLKMGEVLLWQR